MQPYLRIIPKQFSGKKKADVFHKLLSAARELQLAFIRRAVTVNKTLWHLSLGALELSHCVLGPWRERLKVCLRHTPVHIALYHVEWG